MADWASPATIRERQRTAHAVLGRLLDLDLPVADWHISCVYVADAGRPSKLDGLLDNPSQEGIDAWAAYFGVTPKPRDSIGNVHVLATVDGVRVDVWAPIPAQEKARALTVVAG